jgi:hypothetical protein
MRACHRHPRSVALLCIGVSLAMASCRRPAAEDRVNIECVTRLRLPRYPPIAQSAMVGLSMTVAVALSRDGSPNAVTFENVSGSRPDLVKLFRPTVEPAMRESRFLAACGGKTVRLVFSFQIGDVASERVYFLFPNRFEVEAEPPEINVEKEPVARSR